MNGTCDPSGQRVPASTSWLKLRPQPGSNARRSKRSHADPDLSQGGSLDLDPGMEFLAMKSWIATPHAAARDHEQSSVR
jgi:hypothetical protein